MTNPTAHAVASRNRSYRGTRLPLRQLWQVPMFFAGLLGLVSVGTARLVWSHHDNQPDRTLASARRELEQPRPNLERAFALAERGLREASPASSQAAEAHFLLGSAWLRTTKNAPAETVAEAWQQARSHLEQAQGLGVSPGDELKLSYRLGKVYAAMSGDPQRVIAFLSRSVAEAADDSFEGYGLLAQAYLRLLPQDLRRALEATQKQLSLSNTDDVALAAPRLLCGELLRRLDQPEEARKVLARIGPGSPPEILFRGRYLRARLLQEAGAWPEAAQLWEWVKNDPRSATLEPGQVGYCLGLCQRNLGQLAVAVQSWEGALKQGGEAGQAAALGLAEMRFRGDNSPAALEAFEAVVRGMQGPADYRNSLVELGDARNLFEAGCRWYLQIGKYEAAIRLASLYEKLALPGVAQELGAQAAEAYARSLLERAQRAPTEEAARQEEGEARRQFQQAGAAYSKSANLCKTVAEQGDRLWRSATNYLQAQDSESALPVLERFVALPGVPQDRQGEAWFVLGEAHRSLHHDVLAQAAYRHSIEYTGAFAYRARYQLAQVEIEQHNLDEAEAILQQNLDLIKLAPDADLDAHEKSLFTLASLLFQRRDYRRAFDRLQEALERYPANPAATKTRLQFAQCCQQLAEKAGKRINIEVPLSTAEERSHYRTLRQKHLEMAAINYQKLAEDLAVQSGNQPLPAEEEAIARQAAFAVADCRFELGQFEDALRSYQTLAGKYQHQVEELIALRHVWQCYGVTGRQDQARATVERMRLALREMPPSAFDNATEVRTGRWWENWLAEKGRPGA